MQHVQKHVKNTSARVQSESSAIGKDLKNTNKNLQPLAAHLPHRLVQVNAVTSTVPQSVLNFLMQPNPNNKNQ
jgi:hypothetical protein